MGHLGVGALPSLGSRVRHSRSSRPKFALWEVLGVYREYFKSFEGITALWGDYLPSREWEWYLLTSVLSIACADPVNSSELYEDKLFQLRFWAEGRGELVKISPWGSIASTKTVYFPLREGETEQKGALGSKIGEKAPFFAQLAVDNHDFYLFRPFFGVFYDFPPTSWCFFRHRADIFLFFEIFWT